MLKGMRVFDRLRRRNTMQSESSEKPRHANSASWIVETVPKLATSLDPNIFFREQMRLKWDKLVEAAEENPDVPFTADAVSKNVNSLFDDYVTAGRKALDDIAGHIHLQWSLFEQRFEFPATHEDTLFEKAKALLIQRASRFVEVEARIKELKTSVDQLKFGITGSIKTEIKRQTDWRIAITMVIYAAALLVEFFVNFNNMKYGSETWTATASSLAFAVVELWVADLAGRKWKQISAFKAAQKVVASAFPKGQRVQAKNGTEYQLFEPEGKVFTTFWVALATCTSIFVAMLFIRWHIMSTQTGEKSVGGIVGTIIIGFLMIAMFLYKGNTPGVEHPRCEELFAAEDELKKLDLVLSELKAGKDRASDDLAVLVKKFEADLKSAKAEFRRPTAADLRHKIDGLKARLREYAQAPNAFIVHGDKLLHEFKVVEPVEWNFLLDVPDYSDITGRQLTPPIDDNPELPTVASLNEKFWGPALEEAERTAEAVRLEAQERAPRRAAHRSFDEAHGNNDSHN